MPPLALTNANDPVPFVPLPNNAKLPEAVIFCDATKLLEVIYELLPSPALWLTQIFFDAVKLPCPSIYTELGPRHCRKYQP